MSEHHDNPHTNDPSQAPAPQWPSHQQVQPPPYVAPTTYEQQPETELSPGLPHRRSGNLRRRAAMVGLASVGVIAVGLVGGLGMWATGIIGGDQQATEQAFEKGMEASTDRIEIDGDRKRGDHERPGRDTIDEEVDIDYDSYRYDFDDYLIDTDDDIDDGGTGGSRPAPDLSTTPTSLSVSDYAARRCVEVGPAQIGFMEMTASFAGTMDLEAVSASEALGFVVELETWIDAEVAFQDRYQVDHPDGASYRAERARYWSDFSAAVHDMDMDAMGSISADIFGMTSSPGLDLAVAELSAPECAAVADAELDFLGTSFALD